MVSGVNVCVKYVMFVFNFIFFLMGCAILGLGIWLHVEKDKVDFGNTWSKYGLNAATLIIVAGVIILVVSFLGCCGAIKEIAPMLLAFFVLMVVIFILEIAGGSLAYAKRGQLEDDLEKEFMDAIKNKYGEPDEKSITSTIDTFQERFDCCGFSTFRDYLNSNYNKRTRSIPKSCCKAKYRKDSSCGGTSTADVVAYETKGCYPEVKKLLKDNLLIIGGSAIAFAMIQIVGMVFAMVLYCDVQRDNKGILA